MRTHDVEPGRAETAHVRVSPEMDDANPVPLQAASEGQTTALDSGALLKLQRLAGNSVVTSLLGEETEKPSPVREVVTSGGGSPLESSTRKYMESHMGADFGDVRVHTGPKADESARSINAQAYTSGNNVVFQAGKYAPQTASGLHTLAHELTHVVQQKAGPVAGMPGPGGIKVSDPADSFEQAAELNARRVTQGEAIVASLVPGALYEDQVMRLAAKVGGDQEEEEEEEGASRPAR